MAPPHRGPAPSRPLWEEIFGEEKGAERWRGGSESGGCGALQASPWGPADSPAAWPAAPHTLPLQASVSPSARGALLAGEVPRQCPPETETTRESCVRKAEVPFYALVVAEERLGHALGALPRLYSEGNRARTPSVVDMLKMRRTLGGLWVPEPVIRKLRILNPKHLAPLL